jgi:hypothetical protein
MARAQPSIPGGDTTRLPLPSANEDEDEDEDEDADEVGDGRSSLRDRPASLAWAALAAATSSSKLWAARRGGGDDAASTSAAATMRPRLAPRAAMMPPLLPLVVVLVVVPVVPLPWPLPPSALESSPPCAPWSRCCVKRSASFVICLALRFRSCGFRAKEGQ